MQEDPRSKALKWLIDHFLYKFDKDANGVISKITYVEYPLAVRREKTITMDQFRKTCGGISEYDAEQVIFQKWREQHNY